MTRKRLYLDSLTVRDYCQCGAKLEATSSPPEMAREVARLFAEVHRGVGHGGATPAQARKARERLRREYFPAAQEGEARE